MAPPSVDSPLNDCTNCLLIMIILAIVAGVFIVISAILCELVLRGSVRRDRRGVQSVWRQGGALWIEPTQSHRDPDILARPSETVPLWIQRSNDWFLHDLPADPMRCDSTEDLQTETYSPHSCSPLYDQEGHIWGVQPRVTLQELEGFFHHNNRHI
ncbi:hypothetical protein JRQ81_006013 [Phrynocephalus forsythii]|uniref:Uncharacterized protein n=1 Tax=Phrynocephalus forsythii TaxID=171643 RepID=A0A9Q0XHH3_9SAUR|nr:hypothetical protein JRQ81_006013 [Phrynocephalus forsythii]